MENSKLVDSGKTSQLDSPVPASSSRQAGRQSEDNKDQIADKLAGLSTSDSISSSKTEPVSPTAATDTVRTIENDYRFYQPLDPAKRETRLLMLKPEPEGSTERVKCYLLTISIDDPARKGRYECLSYCWGDMSDTLPMTLIYAGVGVKDSNGNVRQAWSEYRITRSLYEALCVYRVQGYLTNTNVLVWADAVCINQSLISERSAQVAMMRDIYASAGHTTVWLGAGDDRTKLALYFGLILALKKDDKTISDWEDGPESLAGVATRRIDGLLDRSLTFTEEELGSKGFLIMRQAIQHLFSRPWFRRVWVLQEVFVSKDVAVQCGDQQVPWVSILKLDTWEQRCIEAQGKLWWSKPEEVELFPGVQAYMYKNHENENWTLGHAWWMLALWQKQGSLPLSVLQWNLDDFNATDDRDRVFALLGFAEEVVQQPNVDHALIPDYSKSVEEVYTDFRGAMIKTHQTLEILSRINTYGSATKVRTRRPGLASWVPEYEKAFDKRRAFGLQAHRLYDIHGDQQVQTGTVMVAGAGNVLHLHGRIIDTLVLPLNKTDMDTMIFVTTGEDGSVCPDARLGLTLVFDGVQRLWTTHVAPLSTHSPYDDLLTAFIMCLLAGRTDHENAEFLKEEHPYLSSISQIPELTAHFAAFWQLKDPDFAALPERTGLYTSRQQLASSAETGKAKEFGKRLQYTCHERCFLITDKKRIGLCPYGSRAGDVIAVLDGGYVPFVLRPRVDHGMGHYELVGECYVQGVMHGSDMHHDVNLEKRAIFLH